MSMNQTRRVRVIKREQRAIAAGSAEEVSARDQAKATDSARAVCAAVSSWVRELRQREREEMRSFGRLFGQPLPQQ